MDQQTRFPAVRRKQWALVANPRRVADPRIEDVALVKKLIAKAYSPLIVGQTWKMLDG